MEATTTAEVATVEEEVMAVVGADTVVVMTTGAADVEVDMAVQVVVAVVSRSAGFFSSMAIVVSHDCTCFDNTGYGGGYDDRGGGGGYSGGGGGGYDRY